jgi:hypothetical protein
MGLVAGLAALAKTSALPLTGVMAAAVLWGDLRRRQRAANRHGADVQRRWLPSSTVRNLALLILTAVITAGWWYLRNTVRYGDPLGLGTHRDTPWARAQTASLVDLAPELPLLVRSFWYGYGWGHVTWPEGIAWALTAISAVLWIRALALWIGTIGRHLGSGTEEAATDLDRGWILALTLGWAGAIAIALLRWMQMVEAPHGRLLFPAIGAWALWLTLGLRSRDRHPPPGPHAMGLTRTLMLGVLASLTVLAPGARLLATYAPPRLRDPARLPPACEPRELTYGGTARLLCADVSPVRVPVGGKIRVRGCWQAASPMTEDYTVFVHLIDDQMNRVAERHTYPGLGRFPTSLWPEGRAFCDTYRLTVEPWADAPRVYRVEIGLFEAKTGRRLPATIAGDGVLDPPIIGSASVIPETWETPEPDVARDVILGDFARLLGFDAPAQARPGETANVTLYWEATATHPADAIAFVHLWSPGRDAPWAQHDAPPRAGGYPTAAWVEGDLIPDTHPVTLPEDLPPGRYPLWAGLYRRSDGTRLPAVGPEGRLPHDLVPLGTIEVEQDRGATSVEGIGVSAFREVRTRRGWLVMTRPSSIIHP